MGIVAVAGLGAIFYFSGNNSSQQNGPTSPVGDTDRGGPVQRTLAPQVEKRVIVAGHKIQNGKLTVPAGTTVVFENRDSFQGLPYSAHTITTGTIDPTGQSGVAGVVPNSGSGVPDGIINASLQNGDEFSYTFGDAGTFTFYVAEHPLVAGEGVVTVTAVEETMVNAEAGEVIEMNSVSFSFSPDRISTQADKRIDIDVTSVEQHTFTIDELEMSISTPHGKTTRVSFTPDKTGTFEYYCAIPGHKEAGQVGTITVFE